jgi:large subunit ribosomal protein L29
MKLKEFRDKDVAALQQMLVELTGAAYGLQFKDANKQLKNVRDVRKTKTMIAQVKTLLKQRQA